MVRMTMLTVVLVLMLSVHVSLANNDYCQIESCNNLPHTACPATFQGKPNLCQRIIKKGLTTEEAQKIVNMHNKIRQRVASGREPRGNPGPQPSALFMPNLSWDDELASIAQKWADQCNFSHDSCRNVQRFRVGQNIATRGTTDTINTLKLEDLVKLWYDEVDDFNKDYVSKYGVKAGNGKVVGHYTQMVWAESTKIGCGAVKYNDGKFNNFYLVCNYGPGGNVLGEPVYKKSSSDVFAEKRSNVDSLASHNGYNSPYIITVSVAYLYLFHTYWGRSSVIDPTSIQK